MMGSAPEITNQVHPGPVNGRMHISQGRNPDDRSQTEVEEAYSQDQLLTLAWTRRLTSAAVSLVVVSQVGFLLTDWHVKSQFPPTLLAFHLFNICATLLFLGLIQTDWFIRHWRASAFGLCFALIFGTTGIALFFAAAESLFITVIFTLFATAALLPWELRWQRWLTVVAAAAMAIDTWAPFSSSLPLEKWVGFLFAGLLSYFITFWGNRYRRKLSAQMQALAETHGNLLAEIAQRGEAVAERERAQKKVLESEGKFRKIFEASPDSIVVTRLPEGTYLDVNDTFVAQTGFTPEDTFGHTTLALGRWVHKEERGRYLNKVKHCGVVHNMEVSLRKKDGTIAPSLISGALTEFGGQPCVVSIIRDISELKRTERALIDAREELSAQVEALHKSQEQLKAEIAERELAQKKVQESEAKLRKIFEASTDAITINSLIDGRYIDFNKRFLDAGYEREEVLGKTAGTLGIWTDREQLRQFVKALREQGSVPNMEVEFRMKDGTVVPSLISAKVMELGGEPCIVSITRDITRLKQTEHDLIATQQALSAQVQALSESQEKLRAEMAERELVQKRLRDSEMALRKVFETSPDAIVVASMVDGRLIEFNDEFEEVTGFGREEALGTTLDKLHVWADNSQLKRCLHELRAHGFVRNREVEFRRRDGVVFPYLFSAVLAEFGGEPCVLAISRDIAELKKTERALVTTREAALAASQAKSEFLSSMSHEIRTPMNAILGMADLLSETPLSFEQRRYLETMRTNGDLLLNLINSILDLAKVESGRLSLEHETFDLNDLIEKALETLGTRAHEKGLELVGRILADVPPYLVGDALRLRQILVNLLSNAIKFTEKGEVVLTVQLAQRQKALGFRPSCETEQSSAEVGADTPGDQSVLCFSVSDTGIGIPNDKLDAVFLTFTQADPSMARRYGGSGLGLAIVKRLVELMNGRIWVESELGKGSTFYFTIPFGVATPGTRPSLPLPMPDRSSDRIGVTYGANHANGADHFPVKLPDLTGMRILVVDDTSANRTVLREMLAGQGAEITESENGDGALDELRGGAQAAYPYRLILLDGRMPGMDGIEVAQRIVEGKTVAGAGPHSIILMLSSDDLNPNLARLHELGLDSTPRCGYLVKPIRRSEVFEAIAAAMSEQPGFHARISGSHSGPESPATALRTAPLHILLAEDSPDNCLLIEAYLKHTPYSLECAENGRVAVDKFTSGTYDLVLMDIQMPIMDGYAAVRKIRQWECEHHAARTPIIALTASALDEAVRRTLQAGCDAHVAKPVKKAALLEAIRLAVRANVPALQTITARPGGVPGDSDRDCDCPSEKFVVEVSSDLSDLIPGFLARKRDEAKTILAAVERNDYKVLGDLAHRIKGQGGSYGLDALTEFGGALEEAANHRNIEAARNLAHALANYLEQLEIVYGD
jgi:PAS domain S-box-containing protein